MGTVTKPRSSVGKDHSNPKREEDEENRKAHRILQDLYSSVSETIHLLANSCH